MQALMVLFPIAMGQTIASKMMHGRQMAAMKMWALI